MFPLKVHNLPQSLDLYPIFHSISAGRVLGVATGGATGFGAVKDHARGALGTGTGETIFP